MFFKRQQILLRIGRFCSLRPAAAVLGFSLLMTTGAGAQLRTGAVETAVPANGTIIEGGNLTLGRIFPFAPGLLAPQTPSAAGANSYYSNVTTFSGSAFANGGAAVDPTNASNTVTTLVADDLGQISATTIRGFQFSVANLNATAVTARPLVRIYAADGTGGGPGTLLAALNFNPISLAAGVQTFTYNPGTTIAANTSQIIWAGMSFDNNSGGTGATAAQLNNLGQGLFNPPDRGSSTDRFFRSTANGSFLTSNPAGTFNSFGGSPVANFGWEILGAAPPPTAASANISGRVQSGSKGLAGARVELVGTGGITKSVVSNAFGNFTINEVEAGATYVINVSAKKYTFSPQVVSVTDNVSGLIFTSQ